MSDKQHAKDIEKLGKELHKPECLNRHISAYDEGNTCSHRWQAYKNAKARKELYNWNKYEPLSKQGSIKTSAFVSSGKLWPPWYRQKLKPPAEKAWDIGKGSNFKEKCNTPYWHNAHHMVPNAELRGAIAGVGKGMKNRTKVVWDVREGLLKAKYNLNDELNMFLLPMDRAVGRVLELPVHLKTAAARSHGAYSKHVKGQLDNLFASIQESMKEHDPGNPPDFTSLKEGIEALSKRLQPAIIDAGKLGVKHLDAMPASSFQPPVK